MSKKFTLFTTCILVLSMAVGTAQTKLMAHYKLDEGVGATAIDASDEFNDAEIIGTPEWSDSGKVDGCIKFLGTENITIPDVGLTSDQGSIAFWVKMEDNGSSIFTLFSAGDNLTGGGFGAENEMHIHVEGVAADIWTGGELSFFIITGPDDDNTFIFSDPEKYDLGEGAGVPPVDPILVNDSAWHHVAGTWGGGYSAMYLDGELIKEVDYVSSRYPLTNMFMGQMLGGSRPYTGLLDDVQLYVGALSAEEVHDIYDPPVDNAVNEKTADKFELVAFPNPADGVVRLIYTTDRPMNAELTLVDITGKEIADIATQYTKVGNNEVMFDASNYTSGVYFVKVEAGNDVSFSKLIIQ